MNIHDYIFLIIVSLFSFGGFVFGLVKTFSNLFCFFVPFIISYLGSDFIQGELIRRFDFYSGFGSKFLATLLVFIILYLSLRIFFFLIESILTSLNLGLLNRLLGLFFGLIAGSLLGYLFLVIASKISTQQPLIYLKIQSYLAVFLNI